MLALTECPHLNHIFSEKSAIGKGTMSLLWVCLLGVGKLETWEPEHLEIWNLKIKSMRILKIKIRSAQNVRKVWKGPDPFSGHFRSLFHGPKKSKQIGLFAYVVLCVPGLGPLLLSTLVGMSGMAVPCQGIIIKYAWILGGNRDEEDILPHFARWGRRGSTSRPIAAALEA